MKKAMIFLLMVMFVATAGAQTFVFQKVFPDTGLSWPMGLNGGVAIDPAGKIWLQSYSPSVDSILLPNTTYRKHGIIGVYNPNGTHVSFSPIKILSVGGNADTLGTGYGMVMGYDGNMYSIKPSTTLWKINYKTGAGMQRIVNPIAGYASSLASVAIDSAGEVFLAPVLPGGAGAILNADFTSNAIFKDSLFDYGRCIQVSKNGNDIYVPRFGVQYVLHFHSDFGTLGTYTLVDTLLKGLAIEATAWDPKTGYLWVSSGHAIAVPTGPYSQYTYYAFDMSKTVPVLKDSVKWNGDVSGDPRPRGIAFSAKGDTMVLGAFNVSKSFCQIFKRTTYVREQNEVVASDYALSQNYPNPFNPTTEIKFSISKTGFTTLKVYDILGNEIKTLVNDNLIEGSYRVSFDGSGLASGTYMYILRSGDARLANKMLLVK